jgi:hypothetical protein
VTIDVRNIHRHKNSFITDEGIGKGENAFLIQNYISHARLTIAL